MAGELLCCKIVFTVAMLSTTHVVNSFNLSTLYRDTKQTPEPSGSSMCYNRTVMYGAAVMCTVLLFLCSHSWLHLVDCAGSSNSFFSLPKILLSKLV